jgi:hypothetical protein
MMMASALADPVIFFINPSSEPDDPSDFAAGGVPILPGDRITPHSRLAALFS